MRRSSTPSRSRAFLLRVWEERSSQPPHRAYRCSLESTHSHTRQGFESPESLAAYLHTIFDEMEQEMDDRDATYRVTGSSRD
jgi:hypothetical protein